MTISEMRDCADKTLVSFMQAMPDVPFCYNDVVFDFVTKKNIVGRFKALCAEFAPERVISEEHCHQLENRVFANAIIGRERSAVIIRVFYNITRNELTRIVTHELMHIYCAKVEMDDGHFIDIYGSGHTQDHNPKNKEYDGYLNAGYDIWREFIAEYIAINLASHEKYSFAEASDYIFGLLGEVVVNREDNKLCFANMCAYTMSCIDIDEVVVKLGHSDFIIPDDGSYGDQCRVILQGIIQFIYDHIQTNKPWKITEDFISELGCRYLTFVVINSLYLCVR